MQNLEEEREECVQAKADYCQHFVGNAASLCGADFD